MVRLGLEERRYCERHGIPLDRLYDAHGQKRSFYKEAMIREEKWAAYGVTVCLNGHALRTRHGTCLMCDPQNVAHMLRSKAPGYLYVAVESTLTVMKLGFSQEPTKRISIANYENWGGFSNWRIVAQGWASRAGKLEHEFHTYFKSANLPLTWVRNGRLAVTKESYVANISEAELRLNFLCEKAT